MGRAFITTVSIVGILAFTANAPIPAAAQSYSGDPAYTIDQQRLSPRELDSLLAPIALYPDQLLAPFLMAATYPHDVEEAAEWTGRASNASLRGDSLSFALESWEWDPSVKTLAQFPDVLRMMDEEYDWTVRVGNAFLLQEREVMDAVQRLRHQARAAGHLRSNQFQRVYFDGGAIVIDMVDPGTVYVPTYDPVRVYGAWIYPDYPPFYFRRPIVVTRYAVVPTLWGWSSWEWNSHRIRVDVPRYRSFYRGRDWHFSGDTWRHDPRRRFNTNFRRDGRPDWDRNDRRDNNWRGNDGRDGRPEWNRNDRNGRDDRDRNREQRANVAPGAPAGAFRGDPERNRREFGGNNNVGGEGRFRYAPQGRPPEAGQNPPPQQSEEQNNRRGFRDRPEGGRGDRPQRQERQKRQERQAYAGPQLTPPAPVAPLVPEAPRANRENNREERRQMQPAGAFRGDPEQNRRQFGGNNAEGRTRFNPQGRQPEAGNGNGGNGEVGRGGGGGEGRNRGEGNGRGRRGGDDGNR